MTCPDCHAGKGQSHEPYCPMVRQDLQGAKIFPNRQIGAPYPEDVISAALAWLDHAANQGALYVTIAEMRRRLASEELDQVRNETDRLRRALELIRGNDGTSAAIIAERALTNPTYLADAGTMNSDQKTEGQ